MNLALKKLLSWETVTTHSNTLGNNCCVRLEGYEESFNLALELLEEGNLYIEYTNSFTLLQIATSNLVQFLEKQDMIDEAFSVLNRSKEELLTFINNEEIDHSIREDAQHEYDLMFS